MSRSIQQRSAGDAEYVARHIAAQPESKGASCARSSTNLTPVAAADG
jgi:hypothetical protein